MDPGLIFKGMVILLLIIIFFALTGGMVFLIQDKGKSDRTVKTLTLRIALSVALFVLLFVGFATGLIKPHGLTTNHPAQTEKAPQ